ncbi:MULTISPECIES: phosphatidylglycerophosphatase A family protein [Campylobacter]|uniref:phosphatidylglycerophosphatase A family protein n=1 Tax=Campylobacter TaxID=194 RepID=UPI000A342017|nr:MULTISPECIES: phosphatidylglycerophosphatase A [Campylobacter]MCR8678703.1 phosphatidylglycerophosphatase A [Campylobacter sp. RM19072]MEE3694176.1 phosphatidylglycerophosphatase A [Campylobacter sp. CLAX-22107-21]TWO16971.1 phosphatidylglycerophosphatase A [Campylobacter lanienae]
MQKLFVTFFYSGLLRPAPGTWGSLAGSIAGVAIYYYIGLETLFMASILLFLASISVIDSYEAKSGTHDDSSIVIDEVAGVWVAISIALSSWEQFGVDKFGWISVVLAFVFFRILDITKPSIIGRLDRNLKGGLGVMSDDMVAGGFAGLITAAVVAILVKFGLII